VAIGKGTGILAVPLTGDIEAVLSLLESLSTEAVTGRGTNLETLIDAAAGAFQDAFPTKRRIILFSDGEALQGNLGAAVDRAAAAEIAISAVGLGSETGGPAPSEEGQAPVISYRHRDSLQNAAERTGGIYLDGNSADAAALLADHGIAFAERGDTYRREPKSQRHLFLLAALAALGLSRLPGKRWRAHEKG
jgi:Ca-activated chloride channel family protein